MMIGLVLYHLFEYQLIDGESIHTFVIIDWYGGTNKDAVFSIISN